MAKIKQDSAKMKKKLDPKAMFSYGLKVAQDLLGMTETETVKKATLNDIKMEDVQRQKIRLEHRQNLLLNEIQELEKQKKTAFTEAVKKSSALEQKILASKIVQLDKQLKNRNLTMESIFVQLRVIDHFIMIKDQQAINSEMAVFGDMDLSDLVVLMQEAMEDGDLDLTMMRKLADTLDKTGESRLSVSGNSDVLDVMEQIEKARTAGEGSIESIYQEMDTKLSEKPSEEDSTDSLEFEDV